MMTIYRQQGFTLLEVIVASALSLLIIAAILTGFRQAKLDFLHSRTKSNVIDQKALSVHFLSGFFFNVGAYTPWIAPPTTQYGWEKHEIFFSFSSNTRSCYGKPENSTRYRWKLYSKSNTLLCKRVAKWETDTFEEDSGQSANTGITATLPAYPIQFFIRGENNTVIALSPHDGMDEAQAQSIIGARLHLQNDTYSQYYFSIFRQSTVQ